MNILQSNPSGSSAQPQPQREPFTSLPDQEALPAWSLAKLGNSALLLAIFKTATTSLSSSAESITSNTPLHCAVLASQIPTLHVLLDSIHLDPDLTNKVSRTPLHLAALIGNLSATRELIAANASLDELDRWDVEPLFLAQSNKKWDVSLELIEAGANVDTRKIDVQKMLFRGIEGKRAKAVETLLRLGADGRGKDDGVSAMQLARDVDDKGVLRVLDREKGGIRGD